MVEKKRTAFEAAQSEQEVGIVKEFFAMLRQNKKYWLIPIIVILLLFGLLVISGGTALAPFIYTLF